MRLHYTKPLFAWDCLEDNPSLKTIKEFLQCIPDGKLLEALAKERGKGRDDYRVHVLWGTLLLTIALRHVSIEACMADLRRNKDLRQLIGIESADGVPKKWNMSRFLKTLGSQRCRRFLPEIFDAMVRRLGLVIPDCGQETCGDSSHLSARAIRSKQDGHEKGLEQPTGGRKEYKDEEGKVTGVLEWFGYKLHLLVDKRHEVVLSYKVTTANKADCEMVAELIEQGKGNLPEGRIKTMAYDKAADGQEVHEALKEAGIRPVIENRSLWREEKEKLLPGEDGQSNIVYDEAGTVYCYDKVSAQPVRHQMVYYGYEKKRGTLKYRCPAVCQGWRCPSQKLCNKDKPYGKTVRVKCEIDLRRFPPIPRATKEFERLYKGRTAVERVNARFKIFWGVDDGNITGARRFHAYVGAVMIVHVAFATLLASAPRYEGTLGKTRLSAIAEALRQKGDT